MTKMTRQIKLYYYLINTEYHSPEELMQVLGYHNIRMIQLDLKDLRESGLIADVKYDKKEKNYIITDEYTDIRPGVPARRLEHLTRLRRLGIIVGEFEPTDEDELNRYEDDLFGYKEEMEDYKADPEGYIDYYGEKPMPPGPMDFFKAKDEYYKRFPDSSERTRQRDFKALCEAGYIIGYRRDLKEFIITNGLMPEED